MKRNKATARDKKRAAKGKGRKKSIYARKRDYLHRTGLWGFEVPEPKPWK